MEIEQVSGPEDGKALGLSWRLGIPDSVRMLLYWLNRKSESKKERQMSKCPSILLRLPFSGIRER